MTSTAAPENIEELGLVALRNGLLKIRALCNDDPRGAYRLADALHNLPQALLLKDYPGVQAILEHTQDEVATFRQHFPVETPAADSMVNQARLTTELVSADGKVLPVIKCDTGLYGGGFKQDPGAK